MLTMTDHQELVMVVRSTKPRDFAAGKALAVLESKLLNAMDALQKEAEAKKVKEAVAAAKKDAKPTKPKANGDKDVGANA